MKKFTFIGRKTSYADSVVILANSKKEAERILLERIDNEEIEFNESPNECNYNFEIDSIEPVYTPMQSISQNQPTLNGYTPMSSLQNQLVDDDGDDDEDFEEETSFETNGYTPMSAIQRPEEKEESSAFFGATTLLNLVEKLATQVYKLEQKLSRNKD